MSNKIKQTELIALNTSNSISTCDRIVVDIEKERTLSIKQLNTILKPLSSAIINRINENKAKRKIRIKNRRYFLPSLFDIQNLINIINNEASDYGIQCENCINSMKKYAIFNKEINPYVKCKRHSIVQSIVDCLSNPAKNGHLNTYGKGEYSTCSHSITFDNSDIPCVIVDNEYSFYVYEEEYKQISESIVNHN